MECSAVSERLPWYLNGSLPSGEQEILKRHLDQCRDCRRELNETLAAIPIYASHIATDVLHDYALNGQVPDWETALIEDHLGACDACRTACLMVRESYRLLDTTETETGRRPAMGNLLVMAALLLIGLGLGWQWGRHSPVTTELPQTGFLTLNLFPGEMPLRSSGQASKLPAGKGIALILHSQLPLSVQNCRIQIRELDGGVKWSSRIDREEDGTFTLLLPPAFVATESLWLYVDGSRDPAEHYPLRAHGN